MKRRTVIAVCMAVLLVLVAAPAAPIIYARLHNQVYAGGHAVTREARALHDTLLIADLHTDALLWSRDLTVESGWGHVDLPRLIMGNVALQAFSVVTKTPRGLNIERNSDDSDNITLLAVLQGWPPRTWGSLLQRALYQADRLRSFSANSGGRLRFIASRRELDDYLQARRRDRGITAGWLTLEGAHALEGSLEHLDDLYRAGFRMAAPTHFFDTEVAGSAHGMVKGGLTEFGRRWVAEMERRRMIIDLAHASARTIDDVLAVAQRPLMVSHTGVRATCDNPRNLSDDQLRRIAQRGGLIGIGFWDTAVCGKDVAAIARAIKHAVAIVGERHVALGSDFDGAVTTPIDAARMAELTQALLDAGLAPEQIRRVAGENVIDFLLVSLPEN